MKIIKEIDGLTDFEPWSSAVSTYETLTYEQLKQLDSILEECYPEGATDTEINDLLRFDTDWIAEMLGFRNWEHLERVNSGNYKPIKIKCYNIDWDIDDYEDCKINLPEEVTFEFEDEDDIEEYYEAKEDSDIDDWLADKLSDEYDVCVNSFDYNVMQPSED